MFARRNFSPACAHSACESTRHRSPVISFKAHHEPAAPEPEKMLVESWLKKCLEQLVCKFVLCFFLTRLGKEQSDIRESGTFNPAKKSVMPGCHKRYQLTCTFDHITKLSCISMRVWSQHKFLAKFPARDAILRPQPETWHTCTGESVTWGLKSPVLRLT